MQKQLPNSPELGHVSSHSPWPFDNVDCPLPHCLILTSLSWLLPFLCDNAAAVCLPLSASFESESTPESTQLLRRLKSFISKALTLLTNSLKSFSCILLKTSEVLITLNILHHKASVKSKHLGYKTLADVIKHLLTLGHMVYWQNQRRSPQGPWQFETSLFQTRANHAILSFFEGTKRERACAEN